MGVYSKKEAKDIEIEKIVWDEILVYFAKVNYVNWIKRGINLYEET